MTIFAVVQVRTTNDYKDNLEKAIKFIEKAADNGAKVVALPETFAFIGDDKDNIFKHDKEFNKELISLLGKLAKERNIYLLAGSIHEIIDGNDKTFNTSILFSPTGKIMESYRKIHLFDANFLGEAKESNKYKAGEKDQLPMVETEFGKFGMTVCHDLRFPEMYRKLAIKGADIIFVPSAFVMETGKDHWEVLLRSRAIENQVYIIAPGQFGKHNENKESYGNSMIIDPWGKVIARASDMEQVIYADIDLTYLKEVRYKLETIKQVKIFNI